MTRTPPSSPRTHRTQEQRRAQTRGSLLDATIECLVELGYPRTSMQEICARAGVSKGAFQHHYASKSELMADAVQHLTIRLQQQRAPAAAELRGSPDRIAAAIDLLWNAYSGTLATAAMELWIAARTDPELRRAIRPVDRALGRSTLELLTGLSGDLPEERMQTLFWLTVNLTRGLALDAELGGDPLRREQLLAEWKRIATLHFGEAMRDAE